MLQRLLVAFSLALMFMSAAVRAEGVSDAERAEFQRMVSEQIAAFNADESEKAYSFAAPTIRMLFPSPEIFMSMVKKGYQPVYRQKSFSFGKLTEDTGRPVLEVTIVDATGQLWTALYSFEKQPDGSWKISGCQLVQIPAQNV